MEEKSIAMYHRVMRHENFNAAATDLFILLQRAQITNPNKPRILYLNIDEHRNESGAFDEDMFELQKDFCLGFLMKFFTKMYLPIGVFKNESPQCNDIPDELEIFQEDANEDASLQKLIIENYPNTEFIYEKDVYSYLLKVSGFLKRYNKWEFYKAPDESLNYDPLNILPVWYNYSKNLISELFSIFVSGNFLSARSITRTLIEYYIYINIFKKEKSEKLLSEWYIWSTLNKPKGNTLEIKRKYHSLLDPHCRICNKNFEEQWEFYQEPRGTYVWLKDVFGERRLSTKVLCEYINEPDIYKDYDASSSFVHGQDITAKITPFTFYDSIVSAFYVMMNYIFKTISLFPINEERLQQLEELKHELYDLFEKYCK